MNLERNIEYLAGFLDGEGCFGAYGKYNKPIVAAENTYQPVINYLQAAFGGSVCTTKPKKSNHRKTFRWAVVSQDAAKTCAELAPYLMEKAEQALLVFAISKTKDKEERQRLATILKSKKGRIRE